MKAKLKSRLADGAGVIGSWLTLAHPGIAEIMARSGFDWLAVDLEHSAMTLDQAEQMIRVIDLCGVAPLVRLTSNSRDQIKRVMDSGAHGVIVPMVNSPADVRDAIAAVHYPPRGERGVGLARAQGYGARFAQYHEWLADNAVVIVQIEHIEAVKNIDAILAEESVDGFIVGPYDLSASMGLAGRFDHPDFLAALKEVERAARTSRVAMGYHVIEPDPDELAARLDAGYRFLAYSIDYRMIDVACRTGLQVARREPRR